MKIRFLRRKGPELRTLNRFDVGQVRWALKRLMELETDTVLTEEESAAVSIAVCCVSQIMNRMEDGGPIHWDSQS